METLILEPSSFDETIQLPGAIAATNDATLAAQTAGTVEYIAEHGTRVAEGDIVVRLQQGPALATVAQSEAQLQTAEAQAALAQDRYDRLASLYERKIISALEFEQSRLQLGQAVAGVRQGDAALAHSRAEFEDTVLRAPFAGRVEQRLLDPGERAGAGDALIRLVSVRQLKAIAGVPERYSASVEVGIEVVLSFPSTGLEAMSGRVSFVGSAIDPQSRTFPIEVHVSNPGGDIKPAMLVELLVPRARHVDVLTIPRSALVADEAGPGVYVVASEGGVAIARRRAVVLGPYAQGMVVIRSGLRPGDQAIVVGQSSVSDGDRVEVTRLHAGVESLGAVLGLSP